MPPQLVFKYGVIAGGDGNPHEEFVPDKWSTHFCDLRSCNNHKNLNKCSRCRTAMYCSKECQKADWARHKPYCKMVTDFPATADPETGGEPPLQRHLRLWTARFENSLLCAVIVALKLNKHPENIDNFGLVVTLHPRPHPQAGSRFQLVSAVVTPLAELMKALVGYQQAQARGGDVGPNLAELHKRHREQKKQESGGEEDYAVILAIAKNEGSHPLAGVAVSMEVRFKPINVHRKIVTSAVLTSSTLDWYASLEYQVNQDLPNQERVR
ncbi:hypothetical protein B0H19DRAFT_1112067 [Mycena capillaripes]|nr:hypothetical protein B0H19DRAFT_1112067 [Mycena capillaripes]